MLTGADRKASIDSLLDRLESITKSMDVPGFRRRNAIWLQKYLATKNASHPRFSEAMEIVESLVSNGVRKG